MVLTIEVVGAGSGGIYPWVKIRFQCMGDWLRKPNGQFLEVTISRQSLQALRECKEVQVKNA